MSSYLLFFCLIEIISFLTLLSRITRKLIVAVGLLCCLLFLFRKAILLNTCVIMLRSLFLYVIQCENKIQFFHLINWITWVCTHKIVVVVVTDDQKFFLVVLSFLIYARIQKLSEDIEEETLIRYMHYYHSLYNHNFRWWFKVKFMLYNENYTIVCALYSGVTM